MDSCEATVEIIVFYISTRAKFLFSMYLCCTVNMYLVMPLIFCIYFQGHGNDVDYVQPMIVNFGENVKALQVSCGFNHTGALLEYV